MLALAPLEYKRQRNEAEIAYRQATKFAADDLPHVVLGDFLNRQGRPKEAEAAYRDAVKKADGPRVHDHLSVFLERQGRPKEAEAAYREALKLWPGDSWLHEGFGDFLKRQRRPKDAEAAYREARRLVSSNGPQLPPLLLPGPFLPQLLPRIPPDRYTPYVALAYAYAEAFAVQPKLADDLKGFHRYNAACFALRAGFSQGESTPNIGAKERIRLRRQALEWLQADLALRGKQVASGNPEALAEVRQLLCRWQADPYLARLRDPAALANLPEAERADWQRLCADVQALLEKAGGKGLNGK